MMEAGSEKPADLDPKSAESKSPDAWIHANVGRAWLDQLPVFTMRVSADDRYYNIKSPGSRFYIPGLDGQTPDEYLSILPPVLQPEENLGKRTRAIFAEVRRTQTQQTFEYLLDGYTQTWLDMTVIPIASDELLVVIHDISARKKIERSLAEERERFALLAQLSAEYTYHEIHYPDGRIELEWLNDTFPKFIGFTSDHLQQDASQLAQYIHPDDIPNLYQRLQSLQAGLHTITEYRINAPDGNIYWMRDFARAIKIGADGYIEAYGAAQDITTEKTALEAVQASENRYRTFVDLLAAYAYYIEFLEDDQFRLRWVSEGFETYFGYAPQTNPLHYTEGLVQNVLPEDAAVISARRAAILGGDPGYVSEFRVRTTNGDIRWMRDFIRSEKNPETDQVIAAYGAAQDITEQKLADQALRESQRQTKIISEIVSDFIYQTRYHYQPDGSYTIEIHLSDDRLTSTLGYTVADFEAMNSDLLRITHPDDLPIVQARRERFKSGDIVVSEFRLQHKNGSTIWVRDYVRGFIDAETGRTIEAFGAMQDITAQKQAEAELAEALRARQIITDIISEYIYRLDYQYDDAGNVEVKLHWYSDELLELTGHTKAEIRSFGGSILPIAHPDDHEKLHERRQKFEQGETQVTEFRLLHKNGAIIWVRDYIRAVFDPQTGRIIQGFGALQNITQQKLDEQTLRDSEQRNLRIAEMTADFSYEVFFPEAGGFEMRHISPAFSRITGYTIEEIAASGKFALHYIHPDDAHIINERRRRVESGEPVEIEYRIIHKDGHIVWLYEQNRPRRDPETGRVVSSISAVRDITTQKLAELALRESEHRTHRIAEITSDFYYEVGFPPEGGWVINYLSPAFTRITGYTYEETAATGKFALHYIHPEDAHLIEKRRELIAKGEYVDIEYRIIHKSGHILWFFEQNRPHTDPETGRVTHSISAVRDITAQKLAELALRDSEQRNQRIAEMTSDFAYRIKIEAPPTGDLIEANIIWASERLEQVTGYTLDEFNVAINNIFAITHPDDAELLRQRRKAVLAGEKVSSEFRLYRKTGEMIWVSDIIRGFVNPKTGIVDDVYGAMRDITAQKQAEEALRSSEERYRVISEAVSDYAYHLTIRPGEGVEIDWVTDAFQRITGYSIAEINQSGRLLLAFGHPDDEKIIREHMRAVAQGHNHTQEYRIITKTGETRWLRDYTRPILNPDTGDLIGCFGAAQDISAQKQAEESLRASEERYRIISEMMSDFAYRIDYQDDGSAIATDISGANERITSYSPAEVARLGGLIGITYPEDRPKVQARNQRVRAGETVVSEFRIITKLGDVRWLRDYIRPIYSPTLKRVVRAYGASQDISPIREAQQQIQTLLSQQIALNELAVALGNVAEVDTIYPKLHQFISQFFRFDRFFVVLYQPEKATLEAVFAGDQKSPVSPLYSRPLDPSGSHPPSNAILNGQPVLTQLEGYPDQLVVPMQASGQVLGLLQLHAYGPGNYNQSTITLLSAVANVAGMAIQNARLLQDLQRANSSLTEQVEQRTSQLQKANAELALAIKAKDEFLANISHELRTPLTAILGLTEALTERRADDASQWEQKALATIADSGQHLLTLINDLLDFARLEAGKLPLDIGPVDLADLLVNSQQYVRQQASANQITIHQQVGFELSKAPPFYGDKRRLLQVLINLLNNAVKFTASAGEVGVSLTTDSDYKTLQLAVWDSGIGMPPEELLRMFNPFEQMDSSHTRKQSGTGLGLSLTLSLVEMHGGSIRVETKPQQGSRFIVNLPWRTRLDTTTKPIGTPPSGRHVLAILNPYSKPALIREYLHPNKLRLMYTQSLNDALEIADHGLRIEWVLLDARLTDEPAKTSLQRLRQHPNLESLPIVVMTALDIPQEITALKSAGATLVITKPILSDTFSQVINQLKTSRSEGQ